MYPRKCPSCGKWFQYYKNGRRKLYIPKKRSKINCRVPSVIAKKAAAPDSKVITMPKIVKYVKMNGGKKNG